MLTYPGARLVLLDKHSDPGLLSRKNTIVDHITEGTTADGAIQTFKASVHPNRVSAHFVVDRDGTIYQLLDVSDVAWHASQANAHSFGIEHVARTGGRAPATDAQYTTSAGLHVWLAKLINIPLDRNHIRTHNEASPRDGHVLCCSGALDIDRLVKLAAYMAVNP